MLVLSHKIEDQAVLSLRTGGKIATNTMPIINPHNFHVAGFFCNDSISGEVLVLVATDVREHIKRGFVVDDHEVLTKPEDLIRLRKVINLAYEPKGKLVITDTGRKVGKLTDYAVDSESLYVRKIYVSQRLLRSLTGAQLSIDRKQILEVTDKKIVVKDVVLKLQKKKVGLKRLGKVTKTAAATASHVETD